MRLFRRDHQLYHCRAVHRSVNYCRREGHYLTFSSEICWSLVDWNSPFDNCLGFIEILSSFFTSNLSWNQYFQCFINPSNFRKLTDDDPLYHNSLHCTFHMPYRILNQSYWYRQMNIWDAVPDRVFAYTYTYSQYSSEHGNKFPFDVWYTNHSSVNMCNFMHVELTCWWYMNSFLGKLEVQLRLVWYIDAF